MRLQPRGGNPSFGNHYFSREMQVQGCRVERGQARVESGGSNCRDAANRAPKSSAPASRSFAKREIRRGRGPCSEPFFYASSFCCFAAVVSASYSRARSSHPRRSPSARHETQNRAFQEEASAAASRRYVPCEIDEPKPTLWPYCHRIECATSPRNAC